MAYVGKARKQNQNPQIFKILNAIFSLQFFFNCYEMKQPSRVINYKVSDIQLQ